LAIRIPKRILIILHDLIATGAAICGSFYFRFEEIGLNSRIDGLMVLLPGILIYAGLVYWYFGLYRSRWRFASLPDLRNIFHASSVMAASILALDYVLVAPNVLGAFFFGKITILLYWLLQMAFLAGPRIIYRYFRDQRTQAQNASAAPTLIIGNSTDADVLLRGVESGAIKNIFPVGILSPSSQDQEAVLRGVRVLGEPSVLDAVVQRLISSDIQVTRLVLTPSAMSHDAQFESAVVRARRLGIMVNRMPSLAETGDKIELAPIEVEDLLLRPSSVVDYARLEQFVRGKAVVITGGGGSIGSEICDRLITFGASRLLIIENAEPALHAILERLHGRQSGSKIEGRIADVRDRDRIFKLLGDYKPDLVFHAAALKHVPILENDWTEGVQTNVFGSVNVADATIASGADAMVMISTDKAINPVSILGATKRIAEMYCQALDSDLARRARDGAAPQRIISVRFGNVLASNGSVVPKFKAQIEAGGPITVTHPDMVRYFMTIREACDLVVTAASYALDATRSGLSVYVLNMGQPVKIVDLAERMIRLAGLEPGRDIEIVFSGMRPGERLHEILFSDQETTVEIGMAGIVAAKPAQPSFEEVRQWLLSLERSIAGEDRKVVFNMVAKATASEANGRKAAMS
jgi:O-antigen biosynthesis protein WbqV